MGLKRKHLCLLVQHGDVVIHRKPYLSLCLALFHMASNVCGLTESGLQTPQEVSPVETVILCLNYSISLEVQDVSDLGLSVTAAHPAALAPTHVLEAESPSRGSSGFGVMQF